MKISLTLTRNNPNPRKVKNVKSSSNNVNGNDDINNKGVLLFKVKDSIIIITNFIVILLL